jgi:hypothetical protein
MLKGLVEPPHAAKTAGERNFDHGKISLMDELSGQQYATGLRDRNRSGSQVATKKTAELALTNLKPSSQGGYIALIIERTALNHP